jgi:hypothetical protein
VISGSAVGCGGPCDNGPVVTNQQLYLMIGIPMLFNAALMAIVFANINANFNRLEKRFDDVTDSKSLRER